MNQDNYQNPFLSDEDSQDYPASTGQGPGPIEPTSQAGQPDPNYRQEAPQPMAADGQPSQAYPDQDYGYSPVENQSPDDYQEASFDQDPTAAYYAADEDDFFECEAQENKKKWLLIAGIAALSVVVLLVGFFGIRAFLKKGKSDQANFKKIQLQTKQNQATSRHLASPHTGKQNPKKTKPTVRDARNKVSRKPANVIADGKKFTAKPTEQAHKPAVAENKPRQQAPAKTQKPAPAAPRPTQPAPTKPPRTNPPQTEAPKTDPPQTQAPTTNPPATEPKQTATEATTAATTASPTTSATEKQTPGLAPIPPEGGKELVKNKRENAEIITEGSRRIAKIDGQEIEIPEGVTLLSGNSLGKTVVYFITDGQIYFMSPGSDPGLLVRDENPVEQAVAARDSDSLFYNVKDKLYLIQNNGLPEEVATAKDAKLIDLLDEGKCPVWYADGELHAGSGSQPCEWIDKAEWKVYQDKEDYVLYQKGSKLAYRVAKDPQDEDNYLLSVAEYPKELK